jgi:hypothetical protein
MADPEKRLRDYAYIIRSKNAGPYRLTFDILFRDDASFRTICESKAVTKETIARLYGVPVDQVTSLFVMPMGRAIKVTLRRQIAQGDFGDSDIYGCQQHAPLLDLPIPAVKA